MTLALALAGRGLGQTWPNPAVGCVLVKAGRIVGRGWTQPSGRPHAERVALAQAGALALGATAYVTLEPCSHHGQTSPCADALVAAGIARVVSAVTDSDGRVAGQGHIRLKEAGIKVTTGLMAHEARQLNIGFFKRVEAGRPMVTLKMANSFDGRIATASGESQWITGPQARRLVHAQRMRHDAVMVGGGTARADDPSLTVRGLGVQAQPVRVVCSAQLNLPLDGVLARTACDVPVWICHSHDAEPKHCAAWLDRGARLLPVATGAGQQLDPLAVLEALGQQGLTRVFCEGGGHLAASLLSADLVDILVGFTAGLALGAEARPGVAAMAIDRLADAPRFTLQATRAIGADVMHEWHRLG